MTDPPMLTIAALVAYMVLVPGIALLRNHGPAALRRAAARAYRMLERVGLHQSWVMFTGAPLHQSREVWLRFDYPDGQQSVASRGLACLPAPHQSYVQHWMTAGPAFRAAVIDAILEHCPPEGEPSAVSVMYTGQTVGLPGASASNVQRDTVAVARAALEVE
ncbi:MAG: hypothetical protein K0V04_22825 [Deltaproteobacteria bacterium]|nr:hypothetical protein [Deltaproteobacteria bacterium]